MTSRSHALLTGILGCCVSLCPGADDAPVYDIPTLAGIGIDGSAADWGEGGFRIEACPYEREAPPGAGLWSSLRLAWDEGGLLVLALINDASPAAAATAKPAERSGVEVFTGRIGDKDAWYQVLSGPAAEAGGEALRQLADHRSPEGRPLSVETATVRTASGYAVEMRLPWANLQMQAQAGGEIGAAVLIRDAGKPQVVQSWSSAAGSRGVQRLQRLRLAGTASPALRLAASGRYERLIKTRLDLVGAAGMAGATVTVEDGTRRLGEAVLSAQPGRAGATLCIPLPEAGSSYGTLRFCLDGAVAGSLRMPGFDEMRRRACEDAPLDYRPVFQGSAFPALDFQTPGWVEHLIGPYRIQVAFYDADYRRVETAERPGRYGAIVEITPEKGPVYRRFATLYRQDKALRWRDWTWDGFQGGLPAELGIDAQVQINQRAVLADFMKGRLADAAARDASAAVLLAGLAGMRPEDPPAVERLAPAAVDQRWWAGLKLKTGTLDTRRLIFLPSTYAQEPERRWPLVLFLHGSGERGDDLERVKREGLARRAADGMDLPFILVAPQCPREGWWVAAELGALLDEVAKTHRVDPDRVYVTGLSMGGFGTWALAAEYPGRFAAIVPICGGGDPREAARISHVPAWIFHGGKDEAVPVRRSEEMVAALRQAGADPRVTIYPELGHNVWTTAYQTEELFAWLLQQRRPAAP